MRASGRAKRDIKRAEEKEQDMGRGVAKGMGAPQGSRATWADIVGSRQQTLSVPP